VLLNRFDLGAEILFVALATGRDGTRYLSAANFLPGNRNQEEFGMAKTVTDQFAEILAAAGVKRVYGIVGDSLSGLSDAIRREGKIEWLHVRHEEVGDFAAGAQAHLTSELAVCAGSCGPDNLHMAEAALADLPTDYEHDRYIFARQVPGPKLTDGVGSAAGLVPHTFGHRLMEQEPIITEGSWVRICDSNDVPAGSTRAALVNLKAGAMRQLHWHEHDQWQYYTKAAGA
jgi:hypothetical protein